MKVASTYKQARDMVLELQASPGAARIGVDIGKQFGTRIIMHIAVPVALHLLGELESRDLPLPQVIYMSGRLLIGAEPE